MAELLKAFRYSLFLPGKAAAFRLNRVNMGYTISYICILAFIVSIPDGVHLYLDREGVASQYSLATFISLFLFGHYILFVLTVMVGITGLATMSMLMRTALKRRLSYGHLWKMCAFTTTLPLLILLIFSIWNIQPSSSVLFFLLVVMLTFMIRIILIYPKQK